MKNIKIKIAFLASANCFPLHAITQKTNIIITTDIRHVFATQALHVSQVHLSNKISSHIHSTSINDFVSKICIS